MEYELNIFDSKSIQAISPEDMCSMMMTVIDTIIQYFQKSLFSTYPTIWVKVDKLFKQFDQHTRVIFKSLLKPNQIIHAVGVIDIVVEISKHNRVVSRKILNSSFFKLQKAGPTMLLKTMEIIFQTVLNCLNEKLTHMADRITVYNWSIVFRQLNSTIEEAVSDLNLNKGFFVQTEMTFSSVIIQIEVVARSITLKQK